MAVLNIGTEKATQKIKKFCAYQERNHKEVKEKLYSFGLYKEEAEEILSALIQENYLNEERFALAFAGGKFRMKQWGKTKIKYELKKHGISDYCIKKALSTILEEDYTVTLKKMFEQKLRLLKSEKNIFNKKRKMQLYLQQKGYELEYIRELIQEL